MDNEIWKDIEEYEGLYQISNLGRVKSFGKQTGFYTRKHELILKDNIDKDGYHLTTLIKKRTRQHLRIHRLVAEAFIPNPEDKPQVNHKDGNKDNNSVENLEWCTPSENVKHSYDKKLHKYHIRIRAFGTENPAARKIKQYDLKGNFIKTWNTIREASKTLNIGETNIGACCRGKQKTAGGYIWKYIEERRD